MNKLITKVAKLVLGLSLAAGVGVAIGSKAAERADAADTYSKITATPSDWSGTYLIAYVDGSTAQVWTGVDANSNFANASISNGKIEKPANAQTVTIASMSGGYSIKVNGGTNANKYISGTSGSNTTNFNAAAVANTLTYSSGVDIASNTSHFVFNSTSGTTRFRYYKSTTYTGSAYKTVDLFKLDDAAEPEVSISNISLSTLPVGYEASSTITAAANGFSGTVSYSWSITSGSSFATLTSNGATATLTSKDTNNSTGTVTVSVTATYGNESATTTQNVNVVSVYSVAGARSAIDSQTTVSNAYVLGKISQIDSYNSTYHSLQYWISDNGSTTNQLEIYSGKGLNGADFSATTDIELGATVVVYGNLKKFNSTYEFDASSVQVYYAAPVITTTYDISFNSNGGSNSPSALEVGEGLTFTFPSAGTKTNYIFKGWSSDNIVFYQEGNSSDIVDSDLTFTAYWQTEGTSSDPYSVTDANAAIAANTGLVGAYTSGIISQVGSTVSSGKLTYYISDDGSTTNHLKVYNGKGISDANFTSASDIEVGGTAVVYGNLKDYFGTYEIDDGNYQISYNAPVYTVTYTSGTNGTGSFAHTNQSGGSYSLLSFASLTGVSADSGYRFKNYTVGGVDKNPGDSITLSASVTVTVNFEETPGLESTYNFATNFSTYASSWTTTYGSKTLDGETDLGGDYDATVVLGRVNKQSNATLPTLAVAKNTTFDNIVVFTLNEANYKIKAVTVTFVQRGSNAPTLNLFKGNDSSAAGIVALDSATIGTDSDLYVSNLNGTSFSVNCVASGSSNNCSVDISSIHITLEELGSFGTLDHITITSLPNVVYHVGETFDSTGFAVTAYDGADEASANFKDVTSSVETDLDNPSAFVDGDVPGFDCDVQYTGDGGSDTTSFHVYVYALAEYELVTSQPTDWSGQYLIVGSNNDTLYAMNGSLSPLDVEGNHKVVTEDASNVIETGQELEFTIASYSTGYSIKTKANKYFGWDNGSGNGLLESDSALVNTLSYSDGAVTIAGAGGRKLNLNTDGNGRFRYYTNGSVQLYKLKESNNAIAYAETFLAAFTCDGTGVNGPTFTIKEGQTYWTWSLLATEYNTLTSVEKEQFRLGVASESGDEIGQALARYDYVVGKYGTSTYSDFMSRNPSPIGGAKIVLNTLGESSNTVAIIVIISLVSVTAIGGYFFIKRRQEN